MKVIFFATSTPGGWAIRTGTRSYWNHVGLLFDDGTYIKAVGKGVIKTTFEQKMRSLHHTYEYRIDTIQLVDEEAAKKWALEQVGKPYDYTAVFAFVIPWRTNWNEESSWFCSELVAGACAVGGIPIARAEKHVITPGYLDQCPLFTSTPSVRLA